MGIQNWCRNDPVDDMCLFLLTTIKLISVWGLGYYFWWAGNWDTLSGTVLHWHLAMLNKHINQIFINWIRLHFLFNIDIIKEIFLRILFIACFWFHILDVFFYVLNVNQVNNYNFYILNMIFSFSMSFQIGYYEYYE